MHAKRIGIVGGMGPKTGIDLAHKIIKNTVANTDQDYIPMLLVSYPHQIEDRTGFLQGKHHKNPAYTIYQLIRELESWGAHIIGIPCNTSHSAPIMNVISEQLIANHSSVVLVNMIEAVAEFILEYFPTTKKIGLLATSGTYQQAAYQNIFQQFGLEIIVPDSLMQQAIHQAIYDAEYGIKSNLSANLDKASQILHGACEHVVDLSAELVVLGCSEISLALTETSYKSIPLIDPTEVLARKLIQLAAPAKLKPYL